jgi:trigger factor
MRDLLVSDGPARRTALPVGWLCYELKADEERVKGLIEEMASAYEDPSEVVEFYGKNKELMDNMRNVALEEQAVEAVLAKAKVSEKATSFNELMNQQA